MGRKSARSKRIAALNDVFRQSFMGGKVFYTAGVQALNIPAVIIDKVQKYADFNKDNDPYGEHDFGRFEVAWETLYWKIDYYDISMEYGSPDPTSPAVTTRVLTILLDMER